MRKFLNALFILIAVSFTSCEIGVGAAIDLTAPEITITSPTDGENVHKAIRLEGTCKDNEQVTGIVIEEKTLDGSLVFVGNGIVNGERWYADVILEEGDRFIICTAKDAAGNSSSKSKAVLTIIVDETAPDAKDWNVDRGKNTLVALMTKEKLQGMDLGLAVNKFVPQNEQFTVTGQFSDSISVSEITLSLYEDEDVDPIVSKTVTAATINTGSIYSPSWTFTHNELKSKKAALNSGKHYLKVVYEVKDDAGNVRKATAGYILWYPESDYPGIQQSATDENEKLLVNAGSSIPLHFFDDDELKEVGYALITEDKKNTDGVTIANVKNHVQKITMSGDAEYPTQVSTLDASGNAMSSGTYYLLAYVKEKNGYEKTRLIEVSLTDAAKPLLIVESPLENEAPTVVAEGGAVASKFKFIGYSYDTSGSKHVKIAYIPDSTTYNTASAKQARAKEIINNEALKASGEIVKTYSFKPIGQKPDPVNSLVHERFEFTFDLLADFPSEKNKQKFFLLMVEDIDSNKVYKQVIVDADTDKPEITIESPKDDMAVIDYSNNKLKFKFAASKVSGLGIDPATYKLTRVAEAGSKEAGFVCTFANGKLTWDDPMQKTYVVATVDEVELDKWANGKDGYKPEPQPVFRFEGADILGNTGSVQRTVVLSPLPVLESITVDQADGVYCEGKKITFQAKFSDTVKVTGTPQLRLGGIKEKKEDTPVPVDVIRYATYKREANNSDTLKFEYVVQKGDESTGISCAGTEIDLNGGKIETGTQGTGPATIKYVSNKNFWDSANPTVKRKIELDGVVPEISNITAKVTGVSSIGGYYYAKEAREVLVTVAFTEPVLISGTANLTVNGLTFTQYSMNDDATEVTYSYNVGSTKNGNVKTAFDNEKLLCNSGSCFNFTGKNIKDKSGNALIKGNTSYDVKVVLDTVSPKVPVITGITQHIYNKSPKFEVKKNASDSDINKIEVSVDNGQTWVDYSGKQTPVEANPAGGILGDPWHWIIDTDDDNKEKMAIRTGGTYNLIAKVTDKAGNISDNTEAIEIILNDQFPEILDIKVACENGNYKNDDVLVFKVFLGDTVKPYTASDASLTFETIDPAAGSVAKTINVKPSSKDADGNDILSSVLEFTHKVSEGDKYNGIHIKNLTLSNLQDKYNNKQSTETTARITELTSDTTGGCYRNGIKVDGSAPVIASTVPANNKVATNVDADGYLTVSITFDEPVYKESGTITLQRKGAWGIPAVMSVQEFNTVYNSSSLTADDREILMITESGTGSGNERLDARTGIAVGPYRKITHGLTKETDGVTLKSGAPDISTKFVLDFNLGLFTGSTTIDPYGRSKQISVAEIRNVFEKTGYHQHSLQMNSTWISTTDNKTYNIKFPVKVQEGIEWELLITEGSFRDEVGNLFKGLKSVNEVGFDPLKDSSYTLWTNKASIPVVRVDRYSHGYGAIEPKTTAATTFDTSALNSSANTNNFVNLNTYTAAGGTLANGSGGKTEPTGYVRVRIDTQTPGASIKYRNLNKGAFDVTTGAAKSGTINWTRYTLNNGVNTSQTTGISSTTANTDYTFTDTSNTSSRCSVSEIPDATGTELNAKSGTFTTVSPDNAGVIIVVGDGDYKTARKDYVAAYATLASAKTDTGASMTDSIIGAEGAFKTVIYSKVYQSDNKQFNIEGGTFMGGEPKVSGFPLRDGESPQYSKNSYHISNTNNQNIWNSYEIVSTNWAILLRESANSKNYPRSSYGQGTYLCGYIHY